MMQVMKFANCGDAAQRHFKKRHSRSVVNIFRRETQRSAVHHFAPGPETVVLVRGAIFSATANYALEGMRVRVDKSRQYGAILKVSRTLIIIRGPNTHNRSCVVCFQGDVAF